MNVKSFFNRRCSWRSCRFCSNLPLIVWTASDGLDFRASVCSVAGCVRAFVCFALIWLLISLQFIQFIGVWASSHVLKRQNKSPWETSTQRASNMRGRTGYYGRDPFNQNFRKFRSKTHEWIGSVQTEKFRKNGSSLRGGPLYSGGPVQSKLTVPFDVFGKIFNPSTSLFATFHRGYVQ